MLWWIPTVYVRFVVKWWRGCRRTIHSWGKTFRKANFVINQLASIDRYFLPLTGHSHKNGVVEWLPVAPVHSDMSGELFSASRVLWGLSFVKKNHMICRGLSAVSHSFVGRGCSRDQAVSRKLFKQNTHSSPRFCPQRRVNCRKPVAMTSASSIFHVVTQDQIYEVVQQVSLIRVN
jgi:hypothetical protein